MTILVTGGAGTVGSRIVRRLFDAQAPLRVLCHSEKGLARMPSPSIGVIADFDQPASLADSLKGVRTMMLITPMHPNEERRGLALVEAARRSGVEKIVYLTTIVRSGTEGALHYRSKRPVEEAIRQAGLDFVFLRPNSFHQNDVWLRSQIVENCVYTQPVGEVGVNRIDAGDVASAAAVVLTTSDHDGSDFELHGPEPVTGSRTAAIYSEATGRRVDYAGDDLTRWAAQSRQFLAGWMVDALVEMYAYMQAHGVQPKPDSETPPLPARLVTAAEYARDLVSSS